MRELSTQAKGKIGETFVMLELEKRGWMIFTPHFEEKIDMIAVREVDGIFEHTYLQVKTSTLTKANNYSFTLYKKSFVRAPDFYFILCCVENLENGIASFYVVPSMEITQVMKREFQSKSWKEKNNYTFKLPIRKWMPYKNQFELLGSL